MNFKFVFIWNTKTKVKKSASKTIYGTIIAKGLHKISSNLIIFHANIRYEISTV